jgi:hypothetical protein
MYFKFNKRGYDIQEALRRFEKQINGQKESSNSILDFIDKNE